MLDTNLAQSPSVGKGPVLAAGFGARRTRVGGPRAGIVRTAFDCKLNRPDGNIDGSIDMVVKGAPPGREGIAYDMASTAVWRWVVSCRCCARP